MIDARRSRGRLVEPDLNSFCQLLQLKNLATMNKQVIRIIEQEIATVQGYIDRYKSCGVYHGHCEVWGQWLTAYERILDLVTAEMKPKKKTEVPLRLVA
jgi:hypothetical protein